jgi:myo-inositol-1(or 4)-monophosphatase
MPEFVEIAREAALLAGNYLLEKRGSIRPENIDQKARNDFVTYVDHHSEKIIVDHLLENFPSHKILAEEGTKNKNENEYRWIIDPLDGTKNYIQDIPIFSISIALEFKGEIIAGLIYDPVHQEIFSAQKGEGAFCNENRIKVSEKDFSEGLIATGFPFRAKRFLPDYLLAFEEIFLGCSGMRRCGSAAIDLAYTAMGRFEGFWELGLSIWDISAGSLLIQEAGGVVSDFWGKAEYLKTGFIIAGSEPVQQKLLQILKIHFQEKGKTITK